MDNYSKQFQVLSEMMEGDHSIDVQRAVSLVSDLKTIVLELPFLTIQEGQLPSEYRIMFRAVLEYEAILNIKRRMLEDFVRTLSQLKSNYYLSTDLPSSNKMPLLLSIYLVHLLSLNLVSEFNLQFQLANRLIGDNENLNYVISLNRALSENFFSRLFTLEINPPSELFAQFTSDLLNGARHNHANSIEKSYEKLTISDLAKVLHFTKEDDARTFIHKRKWEMDGMYVLFGKKNEMRQKLNDASVERFVDLAVQISALA